jgi:hypothetical protein
MEMFAQPRNIFSLGAFLKVKIISLLGASSEGKS